MTTVLVVDDRASNRELASDVLEYGGYTVIEASEGTEALGIAHAQHPDLILTDILMPGMDGYQLARELRDALDTAQTPIVFYTANYLEAETRPFALACGVARVLLKSVEPQVLLQAIGEVLAEKRTATGRIDTDEADREHLHAVSAKLFEKATALNDSEARFRLMADSSPVGIVFGDRNGSGNYVNARLAEIMGLSTDDLLGTGWLRCASEEHHDKILEGIRGLESRLTQQHYRCQIKLTDVTSRWLNVRTQALRGDDGEPYGFIGTVDDVTSHVEEDQRRRDAERRHDIEANLRATERLESLGRLAGGVAHDFNNILGVILGFEEVVSESVTGLIASGRPLEAEPGHVLLADLERIRKGGQRASGLTQQLLTFGSRKIISLSALDLNQAVRESDDLLAATMGGVQIVTDLAPDLRIVLGEITNIAQILLNLTLNARHAMPDGGTLTVLTSNVDITTDHAEAAYLPAGRYARLTIRDTGHGMTPQTLERAIEPFFTTKGAGQGSGLGLATVYGIVTQLGGTLRIESSPGHGTAVIIHLPTTDRPVHPPPPSPAPTGGTETILLADDEDGIRETVTRTLRRAGYTILAAANGADALDLAEHHPGLIHLLLSDVAMPGMRGDELAVHLLQRRPATRILFMSGYAGDLMRDHGTLEPGVTVLAKPFTANELLTAIRTMIGIRLRGPAGSTR
jgi:PAS domain S-box-containing protein